MKLTELLAKNSSEDIGRAIAQVMRVGEEDVEVYISLTEHEVQTLPGVGTKTLALIQSLLARKGLRMGMTKKEIDATGLGLIALTPRQKARIVVSCPSCQRPCPNKSGTGVAVCKYCPAAPRTVRAINRRNPEYVGVRDDA